MLTFVSPYARRWGSPHGSINVPRNRQVAYPPNRVAPFRDGGSSRRSAGGGAFKERRSLSDDYRVRYRSLRSALTVGFVAILLALSACGGSGASSTDEASAADDGGPTAASSGADAAESARAGLSSAEPPEPRSVKEAAASVEAGEVEAPGNETKKRRAKPAASDLIASYRNVTGGELEVTFESGAGTKTGFVQYEPVDHDHIGYFLIQVFNRKAVGEKVFLENAFFDEESGLWLEDDAVILQLGQNAYVKTYSRPDLVAAEDTETMLAVLEAWTAVGK